MTALERILAVLEPDPFGGCLLWPGPVNGGPRGGYGQMKHEGRRLRVHVEVCTEVHGPPPTPAHRALHSCDVRACANGAHIRWGTQTDNNLDAWARTRRR